MSSVVSPCRLSQTPPAASCTTARWFQWLARMKLRASTGAAPPTPAMMLTNSPSLDADTAWEELGCSAPFSAEPVATA